MKGTCKRQISRRGFIAATGSIALASCLGDADRPEPIDLHGEHYCDECGMSIEAQPGPVGLVFFEGDTPPDHDGPAWFCSSQCAYRYTFDREAQGIEAEVMYLTDYSSVSWSTSSEDGLVFLSAHLDAEAFAAVDDLVLLVDSQLRGAMGPDLVGFSDESEAEDARETYGGDLYRHGDVTPELVGTLTRYGQAIAVSRVCATTGLRGRDRE